MTVAGPSQTAERLRRAGTKMKFPGRWVRSTLGDASDQETPNRYAGPTLSVRTCPEKEPGGRQPDDEVCSSTRNVRHVDPLLQQSTVEGRGRSSCVPPSRQPIRSPDPVPAYTSLRPGSTARIGYPPPALDHPGRECSCDGRFRQATRTRQSGEGQSPPDCVNVVAPALLERPGSRPRGRSPAERDAPQDSSDALRTCEERGAISWSAAAIRLAASSSSCSSSGVNPRRTACTGPPSNA